LKHSNAPNELVTIIDSRPRNMKWQYQLNDAKGNKVGNGKFFDQKDLETNDDQ
jgi:hypothetical protein